MGVSLDPRFPHDVVAERREEIRRVAREHGATSVLIFGSVARGDDRPGSDLDLLVELAAGRDLLDLIGLGQVLSELLGIHVDAVMPDLLKPEVLRQARDEAIAL